MRDPREIVVPEDDAGKRLDVLLAGRLGLTRGYVRRLLARERVLLGGRIPRKGTILGAGDRIQVLPFRHPSHGPLPEPSIRVPILREERGLLAVDKPAGLPTHPLDFEETATVLNALLAVRPALRDVGEGGLSAGLVHRLDTFTSGVLLLATSDRAWREARAAFAGRRVDKRYLARVHGALQGEQEAVLYLEHRGPRMRVVPQGRHQAVTRLRALRTLGDSMLVEARPVTGLMHQVRATLAHLGHPVLGDRLYGSPLDLGRHLLHACRIELAGFSAESPVPPEILRET